MSERRKLVSNAEEVGQSSLNESYTDLMNINVKNNLELN